MTLKEMLVAERKEIDSDIVETQQKFNELFNDLQYHKEKAKLVKKAIKLTRKDYNKLLAKRNKLDNSINDLKL